MFNSFETCVLLAGFEPFNQDTVNPAIEIAKALHGSTIAGTKIEGVQLPCVFNDSITELKSKIDQFKPSLVILLGMAAGRNDINPERVAININEAQIPDNAGKQPFNEPVIEGAPTAYFSTLPIKAIAQHLRNQGIPASVSNTAGTFVCNHIFFGLMHYLEQKQINSTTRGGFIHVPALPEQAARAQTNTPSMALDTQIDAIRKAIQVALITEQDLGEPQGDLH